MNEDLTQLSDRELLERLPVGAFPGHRGWFITNMKRKADILQTSWAASTKERKILEALVTDRSGLLTSNG